MVEIVKGFLCRKETDPVIRRNVRRKGCEVSPSYLLLLINIKLIIKK